MLCSVWSKKTLKNWYTEQNSKSSARSQKWAFHETEQNSKSSVNSQKGAFHETEQFSTKLSKFLQNWANSLKVISPKKS